MTNDPIGNTLRALIVLTSIAGAFGTIAAFAIGAVPGFAAIAYFMCFFAAGAVGIIGL